MSAAALIREFEASGIRVAANGERLHVTAKPGIVTAELRARLAEHKAEVLAELKAKDTALMERCREACRGLPITASALLAAMNEADKAAMRSGDADELKALRTFAESRSDACLMAEGRKPAHYTQAAYCEHCGPVYLFEGAPARVLGCPWCFHSKALKKAGRAIPRPPAKCEGCRHFERDPINPPMGMGTCKRNHGGHYPRQRHLCADWQPGEVPESTTTGAAA
jgi:hypothetical protein